MLPSCHCCCASSGAVPHVARDVQHRTQTWVKTDEPSTIYAERQDNATDMPTHPRVIEHTRTETVSSCGPAFRASRRGRQQASSAAAAEWAAGACCWGCCPGPGWHGHGALGTVGSRAKGAPQLGREWDEWDVPVHGPRWPALQRLRVCLRRPCCLLCAAPRGLAVTVRDDVHRPQERGAPAGDQGAVQLRAQGAQGEQAATCGTATSPVGMEGFQ